MKIKNVMGAVLSLALLGSSALSAETVYLTVDRLIDPAAGKVRNDVALVIVDGKVSARDSKSTLAQPDGSKHIELGAMTAMPGFIDMHTHLTGDADDSPFEALTYSDERIAITGVKNARKTVLAGFTTVRDLGAPSYADVALRDAIKEGDVIGPRMFVSGPPVGITGGHCSDNNLLPDEYQMPGSGVADGPWAMRAKVRYNIKNGVDLIKTCSTGGVLSKGTTLGAAQGTVEELRAIVEEAHLRGLKVASHAHGTIGIKNAIEAGVDSIEHCSLLDAEAIRMAKKAGVYLSMDIYNTEYILSEGERIGLLEESLAKERSISSRQRQSFTDAVKAGAKVVFGSDAGVYPHGRNGNQFSRMVRFGMKPMQALVEGTSLAAEALGQEGSLGCLDVGCAADIVATNDNPLDNMEVLGRVNFVMKAGVVLKDLSTSKL